MDKRYLVVLVLRILLFAVFVAGWSYLFIDILPFDNLGIRFFEYYLYAMAATGAYGYTQVIDRYIEVRYGMRKNDSR